MAIRLEDVCPKCHSHLIIKEGKDGDFLACPRFPACKFTKPLPDGDLTLTIYKKPSPYCEKCNHTGLSPFVKNGKIIPNAFVDCECKLSIPEHYNPARLAPEDFDFPMSDTFRGFSFEYCGHPDPGYISPMLEELHERRLALEGRPQLIEKLGDAPPKPKQRPEPGLHGGVTL